jgi:homocysteine S-methyltransferase
VSATGLRAFHEPRWALLRDTAADFFAIETIPSIEEAEVLRALLDDSPGLQAWVSFSCRDESRISDGTPLAECASLFADCTGVFAIGINCTAPELLVPLIGAVRQGAPDKSVVVYPNSGERYIARGNAWEGQSQCSSMGRLAVEWFESGARFIGGCCRTTPADIARLRNALTGRT